MALFKVDDGWHKHRKRIRCGLDLEGFAARGLWVDAGSWCADQMTDGWIPEDVLDYLAPGIGRQLADRLVSAGLWERAVGGFRFLVSDGLFRWVKDGERPAIPLSLRLAVYSRDGWQCLHCGTRDDLTLDHIWPYSLGGPDTYDNFQTLCRSCNSRKGVKV